MGKQVWRKREWAMGFGQEAEHLISIGAQRVRHKLCPISGHYCGLKRKSCSEHYCWVK